MQRRPTYYTPPTLAERLTSRTAVRIYSVLPLVAGVVYVLSRVAGMLRELGL